MYNDYEVYFEGIGKGPEGTEHLGYVSQMAVFARKNSCIAKKNKINVIFAKLVNNVLVKFT